MLPGKYQWIGVEFEPEGDPWALLGIATALLDEGNREGAATVLDRAFGIDPTIEKVSELRQRVLDSLAVTEHGIAWRYVPAGTFLMGSLDGDPDEQPRHPVYLDPFWIAEEPTTLLTHARWHTGQVERRLGLMRAKYSLSTAQHANNLDEAAAFEPRPVVAVRWSEAVKLAAKLATPGFRFALPTEAQWEKAARGGLIGARFPWATTRPKSALTSTSSARSGSCPSALTRPTVTASIR